MGHPGMKATSLTLKSIVLSTLIVPLFHLSPIALSNDRPNWAQGYIGELRFDLSDDQRLKELNQNAKFASERLLEMNQALEQKTQQIAKLRQEVKEVQARIDQLAKASINALQKKNELAGQKTNLTQALPELQNKLILAKTATEAQSAKVAEIQTRLAEVKTNLESTQAECQSTPTPACEKKLANLTERLATIETNLIKQTEVLNLAQAEQKQSAQKVENTTQRIGEIEQKLNELDRENGERAQEVTKLEKNLATSRNRIEITANEARTLEIEQRKRQQDFNQQDDLRAHYRAQLIERVLDVNRLGARYGIVDGNRDGLDLAQRLGMNQGDYDGSKAGQQEGARAGMNRDYDLGFRQGDIDGTQQARLQGEQNGLERGAIQGNTEAAQREGALRGSERARSSDAEEVGSKAGSLAGAARAELTGKKDGEAQGEAQAIKKHETQTLTKSEVSGEFAGAFSRMVPRFPQGDVRGSSYRDVDHNFKREIVRLAYSDGYRAQYRQGIRTEFERNIAPIYDDAYNAGYQFQFESHYNRPYPNERDRGHAEAYDRAFNRDYPGIFNHYFEANRTQFNNAPNRDSAEFKQTFASIEQSTFSKVYEQIRSNAYNHSESETFAQNIAAQTEKFRLARFAAVDGLYQQNPILKYESSELIDGGTQGVAAKDGVVMPGETLFYNIKLKNFGASAAHDVMIHIGANSQFKLPVLPAKSEVTIKGAGKAQARNAAVSTKESVSLSLTSTLRTNDPVEVRHFHSKGQAVLAVDTQAHTLNYPFALSELKLSTTPILDQSANLALTIHNQSKRAHSGKIEIILSDDAPTQVITQNFAALAKVDGSVTVNDAKFGASDEKSAYRPLTINAKLVQNGVTLGYLSRPLNTMIKARFTEKSGRPVVLVNSDSSARELLNVLGELGGMSSTSVLDVSLKSLNANTLQSALKGKTFIMIAGGGVENATQTLLTKSPSSLVVTVDGNGEAAQALLKTPLFKGAHQYPASLYGVSGIKLASTNKLMNKSLASDFNLVQGDLDQIKAILSAAETFKLSAEGLLSKIAATITPKNFFAMTARDLQLLQITNARLFDEVMRANTAYKADVVESKHIREDKTTLLYKFGQLVDTSSKPSAQKVGLFIAAIDSFETLKAMVNESSIGKPMNMNVNAYIFGSPLVWNYATEPLNKSHKALDKYERNLDNKVRNVSRRTSPIAIDRVQNN